VGVDEVVTMDVHNPAAFENAFRCRTLNVEAAALFVDHFKPIASSAERLVVVSPDAGGVKRARDFADRLAAAAGRPVDLAMIEKQRSEGRVTGDLFAGIVENATVVVIDDMISGGTTMRRAAALCLARDAQFVHAAATHGVFAPEAAEALGEGPLASIVVTDTVAHGRGLDPGLASKLAVLDSAACLAAALV
jgi:ribose-phosphate pyrophosphokinase